MTVCVAAICGNEDTPSGAIVTASDRMVSWGFSSSEPALKLAKIAPTWFAMIAGEDITTGVEGVIRSTRQTINALGGSPTLDQLEATLSGAWRDEQNKLAEAAVLNPFRMTVTEFMRDGRKKLGMSKFLDTAMQVQEASRLRCQLLVCGFDAKTMPALLVCEDGQPPRDYTRADAVAIGSGHTAALASLAFHDYTRETTIESAIYHVCAAKFMAEKSLGVGKATIVLCMADDGRPRWIFKRHIDFIRALWERSGKPRTPESSEIVDVVAPILESQKWLDP
jgi:hypothetical protein